MQNFPIVRYVLICCVPVNIQKKKNVNTHIFSILLICDNQNLFLFSEEDRKTSRLERKQQNSKSSQNTEHLSSGHGSERSSGAKKSSGGFRASLPPVCRTPSNFNLTEGDQDWQKPSQEELQWYQSQLYDMFGQEADTFLHPKMEQQVKINPALGKQGGELSLLGQKYQSSFNEFSK